MEEIVRAIDDSYEETDVHQALIIVDSDSDTEELVPMLQDRGYPVIGITYDATQESEGRAYSTLRLCMYRDRYARVLVMTYAAWRTLSDILEEYVCNHNLLLLDPGMDRNTMDRVLRWTSGAIRRGFWRPGPYRLAIGDSFSDMELV